MLLVIITAFGCKPDPLEYARPDNLVGTVYPQLEALGTFNYYLQALDKTPYKDPLTKGGSWTVFAPTDAAFEAFMQQEGYGSFEAIPAERLENIIKYSIIVDAWNTTTLTFYRSGFYEGNSFRRNTQYQDPVIELDAADYQHLREVPEPGKYIIDISYGRLKTTTYFLDSYFDVKPQAETSDYDYMFPNESFTTGDMKVFEAHVEQTNIVAENGMIYALDKVIEPRKNMYQNLTSEEYGGENGKYSLFKRLLERFATINYDGEKENPETGEIESIYRLAFATGITQNLLPFNPNDEAYPRLLNNVDRTLANSTGLLVPTNEALENYLNGDNILAQFYDSYDDMPLDVLGKFLKPFFFTNFWDICPSNFGQSFNVALNLIDYKEEDVVDLKYCSNGFFAGINKVYTNNSFATSMGPLLLDPDYTIMLKAVQELGIDNALQSPGIDFSIFGIKNHQFVNIADPNSATRKITVVDYEPDLSVIYMQVEGDPVAGNNRIYPNPNASKPSASDIDYVNTTLKDIVLNQIVEEEVDFNSNNYYATKSGEFIYASGGKVAGGGDILNGNQVDIVSVRDTENGKFYEMSSAIERPLQFTYGALVDNSASFSMFLDVLKGADALINIPGSSDKLINLLNLQKSFTLLAPNNTAVTQAVNDGVIPNPDPSYLSSLDALELATAKKDLLDFAKKHFIQQAIPADGRLTGSFPSLFFSRVVDFVPVYDEFVVENDKATSSLTLTNIETGDKVTTSGIANLLSKKVVIHELDNYIK